MKVMELIGRYRTSQNRGLLDVACGTGTHVKFFRKSFNVTGIDISKEMLALAGKKHPDVDFRECDMTNFDLGRRFGSIICLYGSIAFVKTKDRLKAAISCFSNHMDKGAVLVLVPWSNKEDFKEIIVADKEKKGNGVKAVRLEHVKLYKKDFVKIEYHYLVGMNKKISYYRGHHPVIGLFSKTDYRDAIRGAGLEVAEEYRGNDVQMGMAYICKK